MGNHVGCLLLLLFHSITLFANYTCECRTTGTRGEERLVENLDDSAGLSIGGENRLRIVKEECKKYEQLLKLQSWEDSVPHMIVDDGREVLFCAIPKVASSNWKRVFINGLNISVNGSTYIQDVHAKNLLPDLRNFNRSEQEFRLKNYFKFMFVRNPLERLLSAYRNKIEHREIEFVAKKRHVYGRVGETVLRVKNPGIKVPDSGHTLTFSQFVNTLTAPEYNINHYNVHWKQFGKLCHPCFVKYDFVGKMETFTEDLKFVKQKTGLDYRNWFDQKDRTTTSLVVKDYYKTVSPNKIGALLQLYDSDMAMFGYGKV